MSDDIATLTAKLADLQDKRDGLASIATREDAAERARRWLEAAQARAVGSAGLVANSHSTGDALWNVLAGFILTDPRLPGYLVAEQEALVNGLTERGKASKLKQLDQSIEKATVELREARKREALAEIERQFSPEAA
jgi:hypothetical protein